MALNFPSSPSVNATYTFNSKTWTYTGNAWALTSGGALDTSVVPESTNLFVCPSVLETTKNVKLFLVNS